MVIDTDATFPQYPIIGKFPVFSSKIKMPDSNNSNSALGPIDVPASVLAARIDMIVHSELSPLGFERIRPRHWVEGLKPPIRKIFEFQARKTGGYAACWGFSSDFVPIKRAGRLQWKRTSRAAAFDLCIDPIDQVEEAQDTWYVSRFIFPLKSYNWSNLARTVKNATSAAQTDLNKVYSVSDIASMFTQRSAMKFRVFSLDNYVQTHLAWGLCLIAIGKAEEGEKHLERYCAEYSVDRNSRLLQEAECEAKKIAID
jgi:hypothetical protein